MKSSRYFLSIFLLLVAYTAHAQTYYLMPEKFFLQKGDKLSLHLVASDDLAKEADVKYQPAKTTSFNLYEGKKKIDIASMTVATDSVAPIINYKTNEEGLVMASMISTPTATEMSRSKFLRTLDESDPDNIADNVKNGNQLFYKQKFSSYMKALVAVDKTGGSVFDKPLGEDYEIILKQNPYRGNYGDDISAVVLFKGKPLVNAPVTLIVKTVGGNTFPQKLISDASGLIYFKLSREGIYALVTSHTEPSKEKDADFITWRSTFTFGFSSTNELPNSYKEFGFGNIH